MVAFPDDEIRRHYNELGAEQGIGFVDDAVMWPENLRQLESIRGRHSATVNNIFARHVAFRT